MNSEKRFGSGLLPTNLLKLVVTKNVLVPLFRKIPKKANQRTWTANVSNEFRRARSDSECEKSLIDKCFPVHRRTHMANVL